jgi:hypothetical protein
MTTKPKKKKPSPAKKYGSSFNRTGIPPKQVNKVPNLFKV